MKNIDYGTATYKGKEYKLTNEAYPDNYMSDTCYFADAVDADGKEYQVRWDRDVKFVKSEELASLAEELKTLTVRKYVDDGILARIEELEEEIELLEKEGVSEFYCEDGANACVWDNPVDVSEV